MKLISRDNGTILGCGYASKGFRAVISNRDVSCLLAAIKELWFLAEKEWESGEHSFGKHSSAKVCVCIVRLRSVNGTVFVLSL